MSLKQSFVAWVMQHKSLFRPGHRAIEWPFFLGHIPLLRDIHPWLGVFQARFFSFELQQTKREPSTFRRVLDAIKRRPEDCLLVDDRAPNLGAAASIGIRGVCFTSADALARELAARGLLGQLLASPAPSSVQQR